MQNTQHHKGHQNLCAVSSHIQCRVVLQKPIANNSSCDEKQLEQKHIHYTYTYTQRDHI
jgi:hypothetical protein